MRLMVLFLTFSLAYAGIEDELRFAIGNVDLPKVEKLLQGVDSTSEAVTNLSGKEKELIELAQKAVDMYAAKSDNQENNPLVKFFKDPEMVHWRRIGLGTLFVLAGGATLVTNSVYQSQLSDQQSKGLYSSDALMGVGSMGWGLYYIINGAIKRTPKLKLAHAQKILSLVKALQTRTAPLVITEN